MKVTRVCFLVCLFTIAVKPASATDYVVPDGVTVLGQLEISSKVIGNTLVSDGAWVEYYEPSKSDIHKGRIRGKHQGAEGYLGNWTINQSLICFEYEGSWSGHSNCFTVELTPEYVYLYHTDGSKYYPPGGRIKLIAGNPNNL